jgi:hypothetical protein
MDSSLLLKFGWKSLFSFEDAMISSIDFFNKNYKNSFDKN